MSSFLKNALVIFGLLVVLGLGYYLYTQRSGLLHSGNNAMVSNQADLQTDVFLKHLNDLKGVELTHDLFANPRFTRLVDHSTPVTPQPVGRANPFE